MKSCRYSNLLEDLKQCSELINGDIDELREFSDREKNAVIKIIKIFEETLENITGDSVGDIDNFIENLEGGESWETLS